MYFITHNFKNYSFFGWELHRATILPTNNTKISVFLYHMTFG